MFRVQSPIKVLPNDVTVSVPMDDLSWKAEFINEIFGEEECWAIMGIPLDINRREYKIM